jgi:hypothetical protein
MNRYIPAPASPAPLSSYNAYTTWPGGVDPTAALFRSDNQRGGRKSRRSRKATRRRASRRNRASRRAGRR